MNKITVTVTVDNEEVGVLGCVYDRPIKNTRRYSCTYESCGGRIKHDNFCVLLPEYSHMSELVSVAMKHVSEFFGEIQIK